MVCAGLYRTAGEADLARSDLTAALTLSESAGDALAAPEVPRVLAKEPDRATPGRGAARPDRLRS